MEILLLGPVLALMLWAAWLASKAALHAFVAVLERRGRGAPLR